MFEKICIILLANLVFYAKTLRFKYSSDDIPVFQSPPNYRNKLEKWLFWIEGRSRLAPPRDHFLTIIVHALVCVFIYTGFGATDISFIAALLFAFNPANNQASVWISGRPYAMAALGMTGAMTFPVLCLPFILLATYYNAGFLAPLAFFGSSHLWFVLCIPIVWAFHWKRFRGNVQHKMKAEMLAEDKAIKPEKVVLAIKTFGFYTALAIIPFKNTFYHSFLQSASGCGKEKAYSMKDRFFWIGAFLLCALVAYWIMVPWNQVSFALLWWCICLAPFCNFIRMSQEIAERYIYLPNVGLMIVLATLIHTSPVLVTGFLMMYATSMWFYMDCYQDDYYLLEHSCLRSPDSWFAWHVRGLKRWDHKSYQEAVIIWTMARMISPKEFKLNLNIASALMTSGIKKEAMEYLKIAEDNIPAGQEEQCREIIDQFKKGTCTILL